MGFDHEFNSLKESQLSPTLVEKILTEISESGVSVTTNAIPSFEINRILEFAKQKKKNSGFKSAQVGSKNQPTLERSIRSDEIAWIDDWSGPHQPVGVFFEKLLKSFKEDLFLPVRRFESHFSNYSQGAFYKKHRDQHVGSPSRLISSVLYLSDWSQEDGGELVIYKDDLEFQKIPPVTGTLVFFRSELEHEVLLTKGDRWSLTTWFRND